MADNPPKSRAITWTFLGLIVGFGCGGLANYFSLRLLLQNAEWHAVLFTELALAVLLTTLAIRRIRRRGFAFAPGVLLGITLAIGACWVLLFWVVIGV
jgi:hypothetical protein